MLSAKEHGLSDQAAQEGLFPGTIIRTPFTGAYPTPIDKHRLLRRAWRAAWKIRGAAYYYHMLATGWARRATPWVSDNDAFPHFDVIWAICTSDMNGILAGHALARERQVPLVVEFQDPPCTQQLDASLRPILQTILDDADAVVTTTKAYAQHLVDIHHLPQGKVVPIYLSFPAVVECPKQKSGGNFILLHAGTLNTGRNARTLIEALSRVCSVDAHARRHLRLRLIGGGRQADDAKRLATENGISEIVEVVGELPAATIQHELRLADVLVVIKHADSSYDMQIPGKLFQYLPYGKPILGIMPRHTEAAAILQASGVGFIAANEDVGAIAEHILGLWRRRAAIPAICTPDAGYIAQFSRERMAETCDNLLLDAIRTWTAKPTESPLRFSSAMQADR